MASSASRTSSSGTVSTSRTRPIDWYQVSLQRVPDHTANSPTVTVNGCLAGEIYFTAFAYFIVDRLYTWAIVVVGHGVVGTSRSMASLCHRLSTNLSPFFALFRSGTTVPVFSSLVGTGAGRKRFSNILFHDVRISEQQNLSSHLMIWSIYWLNRQCLLIHNCSTSGVQCLS